MNSNHVLEADFNKRKKINPRFSLRAYARWLELSPAHLSQILSGKRKLSPNLAHRLAQKLALSPHQQTDWLESIVKNDWNIPSEKKETKQLADDHFRLIADWYHYAILSLSETTNVKLRSTTIAKRLGLSLKVASEALERLVRVGLLVPQGNQFVLSHQSFTTKEDVPSAAIRKHHRQNLENALEKLETTALEDREYSSITMAINKNKLPEAKKMIRDFKKRLAGLLETGDRQEVYTLALQLFPLTLSKKQTNGEPS